MADVRRGDRVQVTHESAAYNNKIGTVLDPEMDAERIKGEWSNYEGGGAVNRGHVWVWLDDLPEGGLKDAHSWQFPVEACALIDNTPTAEELAEVYRSLGVVNEEAS